MDLSILETVGSLGTAAATITLVFLLYKTVQQLEHTVKLSRVQTNYRFRPWIGPLGAIQYKGSENGKHQFDLTIKNFGELPSNSVTVFFKKDFKSFSRDFNLEDCERFDLGPMLPNMEKHYWLFFDLEQVQKAKEGKEKLFSFLYLEYPISNGKSGYGMISAYLPDSDSFMHKDMWIENPEVEGI